MFSPCVLSSILLSVSVPSESASSHIYKMLLITSSSLSSKDSSASVPWLSAVTNIFIMALYLRRFFGRRIALSLSSLWCFHERQPSLPHINHLLLRCELVELERGFRYVNRPRDCFVPNFEGYRLKLILSMILAAAKSSSSAIFILSGQHRKYLAAHLQNGRWPIVNCSDGLGSEDNRAVSQYQR